MKATTKTKPIEKTPEATMSPHAEALLKLMNNNQYAAMASSGQRFVEVFQDDGKCWHLLGVAHLLQEHAPEAEEALRRAAPLLPLDPEVWDHLGVALNRLSRFNEAENAYIHSLCLEGKRVDTWINSGKNANDLKKHEEGLRRAEQALALAPENAKALTNKGCSLNGLQRFEEAQVVLRRALELNPGDGQILTSLATGLSEWGLQRCDDAMLMESVEFFKRAGSNTFGNLIGYGTTVIRLGQLQQGVNILRNAIDAFPRNVHAVSEPEPYMSQEPAREALLALKKMLDAEGIPFFLAYGTLLGIYRNGDILPHDKDLDVGLLWDKPQEPLLKRIEENYPFKVNPLRPGDVPGSALNIALLHKDTGISIDLFFFRKEANSSTYLSGFAGRPMSILWRFPQFALTSLKWQGTTWMVPQPDFFLEIVYGPDWRTPDVGFDTVLSGHNLVPESIPLSICYGYIRLLSHLTDAHFKKALAYCHQILHLLEDPKLRELAAWLETTDQCRNA